MGVADEELLRWKDLIRKCDKNLVPVKKYRVYKKTNRDVAINRVLEEKRYFDELREKCKATRHVTYNRAEEFANSSATKLRGILPCNKLKYVHDIRGISDEDSNYFSIENYSTKCKMSINDYINYVRECLKESVQTGYFLSDVYKMTYKSEVERKELDKIHSLLTEHTTSFDKYLTHVHIQTMAPNLLSAAVIMEIEEKLTILKLTSANVYKAQFEVYNLEEELVKSRLCEEHVLYFYSVISGKNGDYLYKLKYGSDDTKSNSVDSYTTQNSLLNFTFPAVINTNTQIDLSNPGFVYEIINLLRYQCLDYLTFIEMLQNSIQLLNVYNTECSLRINFEIDGVKQTISDLTGLIDFKERNNESYKMHAFQVVDGIYKETFEGAEECILLNEYLRLTHNTCFARSEGVLTSEHLLNELTEEYHRLLRQIDSVPATIFRKCLSEARASHEKKITASKHARHKINELEALTDRILRGFKPVHVRKTRKLMTRSFYSRKKQPYTITPKEITKEEEEYLYFFTDICPHKDNKDSYFGKKYDESL